MKRLRSDEYRKRAAEKQKQWRRESPEKYAASLAQQKRFRDQKRKDDPAWWQREIDRKNAERRRRYGTDADYTARLIGYAHKAYAKVRAAILVAYGGKCMCCGETEPIFLEIDHVNGGGSEHYRHVNAGTAYRKIIKDGFPDTFQLLCCNCNRGRARCGGICPHKLKP